MPDETGTETTRSDAPSADESLFGDAADDAAAVPAEEQVSNEETEQGGQDSEDAEAKASRGQEGATETGEPEAGDKAADGPQGSDDAEAETSQDALKVVVSIKGGRATIGVQQPSSDPHIEAFDGLDEAGVTHEVPAVIERARARWEETPKHPAHVRPAPPARRRSRRGQAAAQAESTDTPEETQAQQQTLRLF